MILLIIFGKNYMFSKKVVIITGSTSGIGLEIAHMFANHRANICLNGFGDSEVIQNEITSLESTSKQKVIYHPADMTEPAQISDLIQTTYDTFGRVDILVNNAGIQYVSPIEDFPEDKYESIIKINLSSAFYGIRKVVPIMKRQKWGRIINMASAHGLVASPFKSAYVAAKHGILGLTKAVALEIAELGITCNAICPGYVLTPLVEGQIASTAKARGISEEAVIRDVMLLNQPTKQFVKVQEVAEMVRFLASDHAASITGSSFSIDGGWTAH
jgi:3-hydroxybutyrate dehydrogenase